MSNMKQNIIKLAIIITIIIIFILIIPRISVMLKNFVKWSSKQGSHITFISLSSAMLVWGCFPIPGFMFLVFGAGYLYGFAGGFFLAWTISLMSIAISFPLYRYCCGRHCLAYLGGSSERMKVILEAAKTNGFKIAVLVKMLPFTGGPANVIFAVCTPIHLLTFLAACAIGHLKYLLYAFVGAAATSLTEDPKTKKLNRLEQQRNHTVNIVGTILVIGALLLMLYFGYTILKEIEDEVKNRKNGNNDSEIGIEAEEKKGLLEEVADADSI